MTDARRVAIVTGAGTGLGQATALVLLESGIDCALVARRRGPLEETASVPQLLGDTLIIEADVASDDDRRHIIDEVLARFGRLDILVNNAGTSTSAPLFEYSLSDWRRVVETNLEAYFFLAQCAIPPMRKRGYGRIVNIASVYGSLGTQLIVLRRRLQLRCTRRPCAPAGISRFQRRRYQPYPGPRDRSRSLGHHGEHAQPRNVPVRDQQQALQRRHRRALSDATPIGRFGHPRELGYAVKFLASEEASFITGTELVVDGGWSIW